ncbi:hypothetical protein ACROHD_14500 [Nioella aestuarii]
MRGGFALFPRSNNMSDFERGTSMLECALLTHASWHVSVSEMWAIFSIVLFYLAGAFAAIGMLPETCTQGGAAGPYLVCYSGPLYVLGLLALAKSEAGPIVLVVCAPLIGVLGWQLVYAVNLAPVIFGEVSVCEALTGMRHPMTGHEVQLGIAWLTMAVFVPLQIFWIIWRRRADY